MSAEKLITKDVSISTNTTNEIQSVEDDKKYDQKEQISKAKSKTKKLKDIYNPEDLPLQIGLRLSVKEITFINTAEQKYGIKGDFKFSWKATNNDITNFESEPMNYISEYTPIIMFINDTDTIVSEKEHIAIKNDYNNQKLSFNMTFTEEFEVENFPFDVQDLSVVFQQTIDTKQVRHVPSPLWSKYIKLNKTWSSITNWDIVGIDCSIAELKSMSHTKKVKESDFYEIVTLRIQIRRKWRGIVQRLMLWLLFLGLMSFATFAVPATNIGDRLSYAITMALTIVAFQFVISNELPQVSYMTLLDKYNLFTFGYVLVITMESALVGWNEVGVFPNSESVDGYFAVIAIVLFVLGNIVFVIYGYYVNKREKDKIGVWEPYTTDNLYVKNEEGIYRNKVIQKDS